jgi:deoxyribodipyrimidine photolyase
MPKQEINIVWFKRDLRLLDHEPLQLAQATTLVMEGLSTLLNKPRPMIQNQNIGNFGWKNSCSQRVLFKAN